MIAILQIVNGWPLRNRIMRLSAAIFSMILASESDAADDSKVQKSGMKQSEKRVTSQKCGHILTNTGVWSPDGEWIVYDVRSDPAGDVFDGSAIEMVNVRTLEVKQLFQSKNGAFCGVAMFSPREQKAVFILGPERPDAEWRYGPFHRQGVIVDIAKPGTSVNLDARDLTPPFTQGALRGGSHVPIWGAARGW